MKTLEQLRAALKEHQGKTKDLVDSVSKADATDADFEALEKHNEETKRLVRQIDALVQAKANEASAAEPVNGNNGQQKTAAQVVRELTKEAKIGLSVMAMVTAQKQHISPAQAMEDNGYGEFVKELVTVTPAKGGVLIPTNLSNDFIEILRPVSAYLQLQPTELDLPNGNLTIPRQDSGVSGGYVAEATDIMVEEPTFGAMTFTQKKLAVIVPISNELLKWSPRNMEQFVKGDIAGGMGQKMDLNLLRGDGTSGGPLGIVNKVGVYTFVANTTVSIQNIESDLAKAETYMALALVPQVRRVWVMNPRTLIFLSSLRDGNGNKAFASLDGPNPTLRNKPVIQTTQIPVNLGAGTNASEIYLIEASEVWFAQPPEANLEFAVSDVAPYKVSGVMYSAFQRDVTLIRGIMHHDTDIRRIGAVVKITGVTWGG